MLFTAHDFWLPDSKQVSRSSEGVRIKGKRCTLYIATRARCKDYLRPVGAEPHRLALDKAEQGHASFRYLLSDHDPIDG